MSLCPRPSRDARHRVHDPAFPRAAGPPSSLPPWHYVGDFLVVEYWADPDQAASCLPAGLDPHPDAGRCAAVFADWQSCSDGGDELTDPSRSQYKEVFLVVNALLEGEEVTTCPFIWVDRDFALTRGWLQGFPKKLGSIWITRTFGLDSPADPGVRPGATFGGTCAAYERRVAEATVTLERTSESGPTHNDPPIVNVRHFPRLEAGRHDDPAVHELARSRSRDRVLSPDVGGNARRSSSSARATRSTTCWPRADRQGLPVHVRLHGRRPGDRQGPPRVSRVALVTGGGTGIGAAVARRLAADGYAVAVTGRRAGPVEDVARETGGLALVADTGVRADTERVVAATVDRFGGLDALVLNAGIGGEGSLLDLDPETFDRVYRVNVTGAFLMARAAIPHLLERRGAFVTIASVAALRAAPRALRTARRRPRSRCSPGASRSTTGLRACGRTASARAGCGPPWRTARWTRSQADRGSREEAYATVAGDVPLRRVSTADEIAGSVSWLLSDDASYVNGAVIPVDGGVTVVDAGTLAFGRIA